jgi:hypothetical protein
MGPLGRSRPGWPFDFSDHPLVFRYELPEGYLEPLDLSPAPTRLRQAMEQIVAIAIDKASDQQPCISYSRNKNYYTKRGKRYDERPDLCTYKLVTSAVDTLTDAEILRTRIAPPNPNCGWQSFFWATPGLTGTLGKRRTMPA